MPNSYKKTFRFGLVAYAVLFFFAIVFYKERATFMDTAYFLFTIVKDATVIIQNYRFIAVVPEIFPLLACKMSLSLNAIMLSYSLAVILYYFICYLLCGLVLKNYKYAIAILLLNCLFVTHTFYWMVSELQLGLAFLIVTLAVLEQERVKQKLLWASVVLCIGLTVVLFSHPLTIFPISFALLFMALHHRDRNSLRVIGVGVLLFGLLYYIKSVYFTSPDDANRMNIMDVLRERYHDFFDLKSNQLFIDRLKHSYYWIWICAFIISAYYLLQRSWLKLLSFWAYMLGYILLINIVYYSDYTPDFYIENLYLPLSVFILLPLIQDVLPLLVRKRLMPLFIGLIVVSGLVRIYRTHWRYTDRINWQTNFIKENIDRKLLLAESKVPMDKLIFTWASPYEFWLLSTSAHNRTASLIISDHFEYVKEAAMSDRKSFLITWGPVPYNALPPKYFIFKDTVSTYTIIE